MNMEEKIRLQKQYAAFADAQILQMIKDGPDAYVDGAYALVLEEARRRGLGSEPPQEAGAQTAPDAEAPAFAAAAEGASFLEIAVINSMRDKEAARSTMDAADIPCNFVSLHIREERELPSALLVDESRVEDAIKALEGVLSASSITLW